MLLFSHDIYVTVYLIQLWFKKKNTVLKKLVINLIDETVTK